MVQLIKLELEGFGKFDKEKIINFKDGINFITGLNEVGKSTILEAIMASIFRYTPKEIKPFFCWKNDEVCRTAVTYKTDEGETFRIASDHKAGRRVLEKIEKGKAKEIASLDKNIEPYLKKHFGFYDKKVFENTAFIRQSQMAILEDNSVRNKMKDMIEEVFVGRSEASATKALKKINNVVKDSSKKVEALEEAEESLGDQLETAQETKKSVVKDSGEIEKTSKELDEKSKKLDKLKKNKKQFNEKETLLKDKNHLDQKINQLDEHLEDISEEKESEEPSHDKNEGIVFIVIGIILCLTIIGAIIGIPLIIKGVNKLKEEEDKPVKKKVDSGKKSKYNQEKKELIKERATIDARLEEYKLVKFNSDDFKELEDLEKEVKLLGEKKAGLHASIKTTNTLVAHPEEIIEKLDAIDEIKKELNRKITEHNLAAKFLSMAETEIHHKFTPAIEKKSKAILKEVTDEKYSDLKIEEDSLEIKVRAPEIKDYVDVYFLSQGARDQLYFALRTVMADLLSGNTNTPLILDDPFHNFDEPRLHKTISAIKEISKNKQVIIISHRPYHKEFKSFANNLIEVK